MALAYAPQDPHPFVDFSKHATSSATKTSHLHTLKPLPDPAGNRAERRAAKKKRKKS